MADHPRFHLMSTGLLSLAAKSVQPSAAHLTSQQSHPKKAGFLWLLVAKSFRPSAQPSIEDSATAYRCTCLPAAAAPSLPAASAWSFVPPSAQLLRAPASAQQTVPAAYTPRQRSRRSYGLSPSAGLAKSAPSSSSAQRKPLRRGDRVFGSIQRVSSWNPPGPVGSSFTMIVSRSSESFPSIVLFPPSAATHTPGRPGHPLHSPGNYLLPHRK